MVEALLVVGALLVLTQLRFPRPAIGRNPVVPGAYVCGQAPYVVHGGPDCRCPGRETSDTP